ncbi:MAG: hypothetical protein LDL51_01635 [Chloroflexi bacterium]|nr:hypothetical protein [Chloroflexota bacterium]
MFLAPMGDLFALDSFTGDLDPAEFEDDLLAAGLAAATVGVWISKPVSKNLFFKIVYFVPLSPPPNQ